MPRLTYLDGLRGWAAIFVVLFHVFIDALPVTPSAPSFAGFVLLNGKLAVFLFFAVSGFSLSAAYLATGQVKGIIRIASARYIRLTIPIFAACLIVHLAMVSGLIDAPKDRIPSFRYFLAFDSTTAHLFEFSFFDVFFRFNGFKSYIGPLWTMRPELIGSVITLLAVLILRPLKYRAIAFIVLSAVIYHFAGDDPVSQMLAIFPLGIAVGDLTLRGWLDKIPAVALVALIVGFVIPLALPYSVLWWGLVGAPLLIIGSIGIQPVRAFLENPLSQWLGWISFPLYLLHGPMIFAVGEPLVRNQPPTASRFAIDALVVILSILAAVPFAKFVNDPAVEIARRFGRRMAAFFPPPAASASMPDRNMVS